MTKNYDYFEGWKYISALFDFFQEESLNRTIDSHIAPRYIYRGISKRHFTESKCIAEFLNEIKEAFKKERDKDFKYISSNDILSCISKKKKISHNIFSPQGRLNSFDVNQLSPHKIYNVLYNDLSLKIDKNQFRRHEKYHCIESAILHNIVESTHYDYVKPEQIRSGSSVRLRDIESNYRTTADYLSYTKNLSEGFKTINPSLRSLDELEILAEIQHRGGGSCLVDFSNNFLISLWFAVNGDLDDVGYMFCYDVNYDAFKSGNLSYLNKHNWDKDIEFLLRSTLSTNTYLDENRTKFWLWRPANINGRIARQDSVFIFGIEKFYIDEHEVIMLPIPPKWKLPILKCLKVYLGITSESVFPDIDGYASTHSKVSPLNDTTLYLNPKWNFIPKRPTEKIFNFELIQKGMSCLLKGEYTISLDYFHKALNSTNLSLSELDSYVNAESKIQQQKIYLEIYYSIGLNYRKLNKDLLAEPYLEKAFYLGISILTGKEFKECLHLVIEEKLLGDVIVNSKLPKEELKKLSFIACERSCFVKKFYKVVDEYMDSLYNSKHYSTALKIVPFLQSICAPGHSKKVLGTVRNCLVVLEKLNYTQPESAGAIDIELIYDVNVDCSIDCFYNSINLFIDLLLSFMKEYKKNIDVENLFVRPVIMNKTNKFDKYIESFIIKETISNANWIFEDLLNGIKRYFKDQHSINNFFETRISKLQLLQDSIHSNKQVGCSV